tara:strand:+ start:100 stop:318 length:219 start_codon:yes stop_codon:yes gene_type:complete
MKYKADKIHTGQYAVCTGARYFLETVTDSKEQAEKWAMIKSARWHRDQIDKIWRQANKSGYFGNDCIDDYLA